MEGVKQEVEKPYRMDYQLFANEECSSGCDSGWTLYLEHSSISPYVSYNKKNDYLDGRRNRVFNEAKRLKKGERQEYTEEEEEEEDEDSSMVSDASTGPPHLHDEEEGYGGNDTNGCFYHYPSDDTLPRNSLKRNHNRKNRRLKVQDQSSFLDDTASSPFFDVSNKTRNQPSVENVLEYSQGYSTTQFEVRPPYQKYYDFFQSSLSRNQMQQNHGGWLEGERYW